MVKDAYDLVVIGAGAQGLVTAKTYLQVHPSARVILLDAQSTVGGTWSKERMYHELRTNNLLGTFEYPDFPMDDTTYNVQKDKTIDGPVVHRYLTNYAQHFDIYDKIRFNASVTNLQKSDDGWSISFTENSDKGEDDLLEGSITAKRVVIASGLTSKPNLPHFAGMEDFTGDMFHSKDFAQQAVGSDPSKKIVIIGGAKSAYDAAYTYASTGHEINWIIRPGGRGPVWMAPSFVTPFKLWIEPLVSTRFFSWIIPCTWGAADGYGWARWFLHETWLGKKVTRLIGNILDSDLLDGTGYMKHDSTKILRPWYSSLNVGAGLSIMNYPTSVLEYVRSGQIKVHLADISHISGSHVHLAGGESLPADVIFFATGWKCLPAFTSGLEEELGLPHVPGKPDDRGRKADSAILSRWPQLASTLTLRPMRGQVADASHPASSSAHIVPTDRVAKTPTPFRLHRFMVPPKYVSERSIVYASASYSLRFMVEAHVRALWMTAFFDGRLATQQHGREASLEELEYDAALHGQCGKWTTPGGYADKVPDITFQHLPLLDLWFEDMGLERWRKIGDARRRGGLLAGPRGRLREMFEPYMPSDYRDLVPEWMAMQGLSAVPVKT